jgi:hypothetical protein
MFVIPRSISRGSMSQPPPEIRRLDEEDDDDHHSSSAEKGIALLHILLCYGKRRVWFSFFMDGMRAFMERMCLVVLIYG